MSRPNPSHARAALYGLAALLMAFCAAGALAQSGRKAQKPLNLPTEKPTPADPAAKPAGPKKQDALVTLVVVKDDTMSMGFDTLAQEGVSRAFFERLSQVGNSVEVKDGGKGRRNEAREQAKKQETAYVVYFQMDESGYSGSNTDAYGVVLRTYVYTPRTGDLKFSDTMFQRPYQDRVRVGGVGIPVPSRRVERYPSQFQLEQAARDIADRVLSRFNVTAPPEQ